MIQFLEGFLSSVEKLRVGFRPYHTVRSDRQTISKSTDREARGARQVREKVRACVHSRVGAQGNLPFRDAEILSGDRGVCSRGLAVVTYPE